MLRCGIRDRDREGRGWHMGQCYDEWIWIGYGYGIRLLSFLYVAGGFCSYWVAFSYFNYIFYLAWPVV